MASKKKPSQAKKSSPTKSSKSKVKAKAAPKKVPPQKKLLAQVNKRIKEQAKKVQPPPASTKKIKPQPQPELPKKNFARTKAFKEFNKKILKSTSPKNQQKAIKFLEEQYNVKGKPIESVIQKAKSKFAQTDFDKTKTFKNFQKRYLKKTDSDYKTEIKKFWEQQYKKGIPLREVKKQTANRFIYDTRNRFYKSKRPYIGKTAFKKNKKGDWAGGKPKIRHMWRDKLTGRWIKHKSVFKSLLKALEPLHVRNYMKIHKIKSYQKARKKYLKEIKNMALGQIVQLYGIYFH